VQNEKPQAAERVRMNWERKEKQKKVEKKEKDEMDCLGVLKWKNAKGGGKLS